MARVNEKLTTHSQIFSFQNTSSYLTNVGKTKNIIFSAWPAFYDHEGNLFSIIDVKFLSIFINYFKKFMI